MTLKSLGFFGLASLLVLSACSDDITEPDVGVKDTSVDDRGKVLENTEARCKDGKDNDGDGHTDCADQDCHPFAFCKQKDAGVDRPALDAAPDAPGKDSALPDAPLPDLPAPDAALPDLPLPDLLLPDLTIKPDTGVKAPLPGCPQGCLESEVCLKGACVKAGPGKACGAGPWEAGLGAGAIYVDAAHVGASDGSSKKPFRTIQEALAKVSATAGVIAVAAGTYKEDLFIDKQVALRCRCPSMVTISGAVEIHHLGSTSLDITLDGCRVMAPDSTPTPTTWGQCSDTTAAQLNAVWGTGPSDVLVASAKGEVLRFDGLRWKAVTTGVTTALGAGWGASAASHVVVGDGGLALHFDGKVWTKTATNSTKDLRGAWGSATSNVYAVGDAGTMLRFDGSKWSKLSVPSAQNLSAVWGSSASSVYAVGDAGTVLRLKGGAWSKMSVAFSGDLSAVHGSSATDVYAVGGKEVLRFDGKTWKSAHKATHQLNGVWVAGGGDAFVVGAAGSIIHHDGKTWAAQTTGVNVDLSAVWGSSASDVFAVGKDGTVLHFNGKIWKHRSSGTPWGISAKTGIGQVNLLVRDSEVIGWCAGLYFSAAPTSLATLCLARSRFHGNTTGVDVQAAPTVNMAKTGECKNIPESVGTRLSLVDQNQKFGIRTREGARGVGLEANLIRQNGRLGAKVSGSRGYGVYFGNVESAHVFNNVVRDNENRGVGMRNKTTLKANTINILDNAIYSNRGAGIALQQMQAQQAVKITGNWLHNTRADTTAPPAEQGGDGIQVSVDNGAPYNVTISGNTVDKSLRHGVFLDTAGGSATKNKISNSGGFGVVFQQSAATESANTMVGNAKGNVSKPSTPVNKYGNMPLPLP